MFEFLKQFFNATNKVANKIRKNELFLRILVSLAETTLLLHKIRQHPLPLVFKVTTHEGLVVFCVVAEREDFVVDVGVKLVRWRRKLGGKDIFFTLKVCEKKDYEELKADPPAGVLVL